MVIWIPRFPWDDPPTTVLSPRPGVVRPLPNGFLKWLTSLGGKTHILTGMILRFLDPLETPDLLIARMDLQSSLHDSLQSTKVICIHQGDVSWKAWK